MSFEITAKVLRGDDHNVVGFSIVAGGETYSEDFVSRFPPAACAKEATITIKDGKVVLEGPIFNGSKKTFEFSPTLEELEGLKASIFAEGKKLVFLPDGMMSTGFKLVVKD